MSATPTYYSLLIGFLVIHVSCSLPTKVINSTQVSSNGPLLGVRTDVGSAVSAKAAAGRSSSSITRRFAYQPGTYNGRQITVLYYWNSEGPNYKIAVYGGLPAAAGQMLNWMEKYGKMYNPQQIPPLNENASSSDDEDQRRKSKSKKQKIKKKSKKKKKGRKNDDDNISRGGVGEEDGGGAAGEQCGTYGRIVDKITNGKTTSITQRPWQVGLVQKGTRGAFCGGSLISLRSVITAAHCMVQDGRIKHHSEFNVQVGSEDIANPQQVAGVERVHVHRQYSDKNLQNDIAMLILERPVKRGNGVSPICLPPATSTYGRGKNCAISGWGRSSAQSQGGERMLLTAKVDILNEDECKGIYRHQIGSNMFCGGDPQRGHGTCYGDSGGPFACKVNDRYYLYGLTSWGIECDSHNYPAVYTRVAKYLDWISERAPAESTRRARSSEYTDEEVDDEEEESEESPEEEKEEEVDDDDEEGGEDDVNEDQIGGSNEESSKSNESDDSSYNDVE